MGKGSKLVSSVNKLNQPSARLMLYGVQFSCLILIISVIAYLRNDFSANYSHTINEWCKLAAVNAATVFAEVIIGGLFLDLYDKRRNGNGIE